MTGNKDKPNIMSFLLGNRRGEWNYYY